MSKLSDLLTPLGPPAQGRLARELAAKATTEELIDALLSVRLTDWAEHHVITALMGRGPHIFEPVAEALLANPLAPGAGSLGEVLVRLLDDDDIRDPRVVPALVRAAEAALDAGGGTRGVSGYILLLRDCASIVGPLPETAALARRLRDVAATEAAPHPYVHSVTQWGAGDTESDGSQR
jgi:hypothetical protein